jgi:hypothetical protein
MGSTYPPEYKHLEGLLFVTSNAVGADAIAEIRAVTGNDNLFVIPGAPDNARDAAGLVRPELNKPNRTLKGVVIVGDYKVVPSWPVTSLAEQWPGECAPPQSLAGDQDDWRVWSDDLYGDKHGDRLSLLPVSRMPIRPVGGWLSPDPVQDRGGPADAFGVRSKEFAFADDVYQLVLNGGTMLQSPPSVAGRGALGATREDVYAANLAARRLYLVLHGRSDPQTTFKGQGGQVVVNYALAGGDWQSRGVVFAGVCWGALIANTAKRAVLDNVVNVRNPEISIALAFLERGIKAFVGFTGYHYIPNAGTSLGAPLHTFFWDRIANGAAPAAALFDARKQYLAAVPTAGCTVEVIARHMKTYWSATCLGLGW